MGKPNCEDHYPRADATDGYCAAGSTGFLPVGNRCSPVIIMLFFSSKFWLADDSLCEKASGIRLNTEIIILVLFETASTC